LDTRRRTKSNKAKLNNTTQKIKRMSNTDPHQITEEGAGTREWQAVPAYLSVSRETDIMP
jgi:hypothetical protein